jgi:glutamate--cysteine ligase catalytic subunit
MKASGKLMTTAAWMRNFVTNHPKYQQDSLVSNEIAYELMWNLNQISNGKIESPLLNKIN